MLENGNRDGGPSIRYLEACSETEDKNILGKGWDIVGGSARGQIVAPRYFWDPPRDSNKLEIV